MSLEQLISFFNESIEKQLPHIIKSLNDITGNELEISFSDLNSGNSEMYLSENTLPFISMDFTSNGLFHQIIVPAEQSSKLTELLGTPIEGDLNEEHLNSLKSITGNITSTFIDSGLNLANIEIVDNSDSLNIPNNLQNQKLILRAGDEIIELNLYHWDNQGDLMEDTTLEVQQADFGELGTANGSMADNKIDMLLEVELDVTIELGRKKMSIQEVLQLGKGAVIELAKLAGEPVDIYVNQKPLAKGEVVVVDENFAIRITNLVDKSERLKSLGK
jgi:flagellar motor switch protein FliN